MLRTLRGENQQVLVPELEVASSFFARAWGLLGRKTLPRERGLLILSANSVHTWFMRFSIDLVFVDEDLVVQKTMARVRPWRMTWPVWDATGVIELSEGFLEKNPLREGEKLHVDPALS
jgi:uncharacterized membrane protein (UPF0127 family)